MLLAINHETLYHYTAPQAYTIQQLHLTPRVEAQQRVLSWEITSSGRHTPFTDAYGNQGHMLTITRRHHEVRIQVGGLVDIAALERGRLYDDGVLSPLVFTMPTNFTRADDGIRQFAQRHLPRSKTDSAALLGLAQAIQGSVNYESGATVVTTTAADALMLGRGVCQDHAHLFLACCHAQGIPARYVSGYINPGSTDDGASHAWVDAWVEEADYTGWISLDVTHAALVTDDHCRLAIGRDYDSAAPIRGVRHGSGEEYLTVEVQVTPQVTPHMTQQ